MERKTYKPPAWCEPICQVANTTACVKHCARTREGIYFLLDPTVPIEEMPEFPINDWIHNTSPKERQIIAGVYLTKLVEKAQGKDAIPFVGNDELEEYKLYDIDTWVEAITQEKAT